MNSKINSPLITHISWGRIQVEGLGEGKDFKLYPGGGSEWDWTETGTQHDPGIQPADVEEIIENGAKVVVLSRGKQLRMKTSPKTLDLLEKKGIAVHVLETDEAVKLYNKLANEGITVGGLFHSTC